MIYLQLYFITIHVLLANSLSVFLFTSLSPFKPILINPNVNVSSLDTLKTYAALTHNSSCKTYLIIHGFMSSGTDNWVRDMKENLLYTGQCVEVFVFDWSDESNWRLDLNLGYVKSIEKIPPSAIVFSEFLINFSKLKSSNDYLKQIHCIGHSLGAHMCGFLSKYFREKHSFIFKRISGLDPAGPCFENVKENKRLSKNDAEYVDIIHTSINLGIKISIGHSDYYVNNGKIQPGCFKTNEIELPVFWCKNSFEHYKKEFTNRILTDVFNLVKCSHSKAHRYFIDSIMSKCKKYDAYRCENYEVFTRSKCFHCRTNRMGFHSEPEFEDDMNRNYFLDFENFQNQELKSIDENLNSSFCEPVYVKLIDRMNETRFLTLNNLDYFSNFRRICDGKNCSLYILIDGYGYSKRSADDWFGSVKPRLFSNETIANLLLIDWRDIQEIYKTKEQSQSYILNYLDKLVKKLSQHISKGLVEFKCIGRDNTAENLCKEMDKMFDQSLENGISEFLSLDDFYCSSSSRLIIVNFLIIYLFVLNLINLIK